MCFNSYELKKHAIIKRKSNVSDNLKVAAMLDHFINALLTHVNLSDKKLTATV